MPPKRRTRSTNPIIFVFCEGETEQRYIDLLRRNFRVPIQIVTKVLNTRISSRIIYSHIKSCGYRELDKVFLFYDGDRPDIVQRLEAMQGVELMLSCPCVELWFILHFTGHHAVLDSNNMVKVLQKYVPEYRKGEIEGSLRDALTDSWKEATTRAKTLEARTNPSTTAYILPEYLERLKNR